MQWFSVRISGVWLLILQAVLFQTLWTPAEAIEIYLTYTILTGLAVVAAVGFFFLRHSGWLLAMMTQGVSLLVSLFIYFSDGDIVPAQISMAYAIFMVLFLNLVVIKNAFRTDPDTEITEDN